MKSSPPAGLAPVVPISPDRGALLDALRFWEPRRVIYNLAVIGLAAAVVVRTWPHFHPAFHWGVVPQLLVFGVIANVCYSAAYVPELLMLDPSVRPAWRKWRGALFVAGTLFALFLELYWIADEIYPYVSVK